MEHIKLRKDKLGEIIILALNKIGDTGHTEFVSKTISDALIEKQVKDSFVQKIIAICKQLAGMNIKENLMFVSLEEYSEYCEWEKQRGSFILNSEIQTIHQNSENYLGFAKAYGVTLYILELRKL